MSHQDTPRITHQLIRLPSHEHADRHERKRQIEALYLDYSVEFDVLQQAKLMGVWLEMAF